MRHTAKPYHPLWLQGNKNYRFPVFGSANIDGAPFPVLRINGVREMLHADARLISFFAFFAFMIQRIKLVTSEGEGARSLMPGLKSVTPPKIEPFEPFHLSGLFDHLAHC